MRRNCKGNGDDDAARGGYDPWYYPSSCRAFVESNFFNILRNSLIVFNPRPSLYAMGNLARFINSARINAVSFRGGMYRRCSHDALLPDGVNDSRVRENGEEVQRIFSAMLGEAISYVPTLRFNNLDQVQQSIFYGLWGYVPKTLRIPFLLIEGIVVSDRFVTTFMRLLAAGETTTVVGFTPHPDSFNVLSRDWTYWLRELTTQVFVESPPDPEQLGVMRVWFFEQLAMSDVFTIRSLSLGVVSMSERTANSDRLNKAILKIGSRTPTDRIDIIGMTPATAENVVKLLRGKYNILMDSATTGMRTVTFVSPKFILPQGPRDAVRSATYVSDSRQVDERRGKARRLMTNFTATALQVQFS